MGEHAEAALEENQYFKDRVKQKHLANQVKAKKVKTDTKLTRELRARANGKAWYHAKFQMVSTEELTNRLCDAYIALFNEKEKVAKK